MDSLKVYYQCAAGLKGKRLQDFKVACSQSDFDVVCITMSSLIKGVPDDAVVDTGSFDIFRLDYEHIAAQNYRTWGTFVATRKRLSAYARGEWATEGVDCVWVTVPARGCRSRLHIACVNFYESLNIDIHTETLEILSKSHPIDKFLVLEQFPFYDRSRIYPYKPGKLQTRTPDEPANKVIRGLYISTSVAELYQCNSIKDRGEVLHSLVFSSVHVTVAHCPRPLVPEKKNWQRALQFDLNIGPPECCKATSNAGAVDCRNALRSRQMGVNTSGDMNKLMDGLIKQKWSDVVKLVDEKLKQTVKQNALARSAGESSRGRIEILEDVSKKITNIEERMEVFDGNSKRFASIEERLKMFEDNSKRFANIEERLKMLEDNSKRFVNIEGRLKEFEVNSKNFANIEGRLKTLEERALTYREKSDFGTTKTTTASTFRRMLVQQTGRARTAAAVDSVATGRTPGLFGSSAVLGASGLFGASATSSQGAPASGASSGQQDLNFGKFSAGTSCGDGAHNGSTLFGQPRKAEQSEFGANAGGLLFGGNTANTETGLFGATPQHSAALFGQQTTAPLTCIGGSGEPQANGTVVNFSPVVIVKGDQTQPINISYNGNMFSKVYEHEPLEENSVNRKGSPAVGVSGKAQQGVTSGQARQGVTSVQIPVGSCTTLAESGNKREDKHANDAAERAGNVLTGIFARPTTKPKKAFGATPPGIGAFTFGNTASQAAKTQLLDVKPAPGGGGLLQATSRGSKSEGVTTSATPAQTTETLFSSKLDLEAFLGFRTASGTATSGESSGAAAIKSIADVAPVKAWSPNTKLTGKGELTPAVCGTTTGLATESTLSATRFSTSRTTFNKGTASSTSAFRTAPTFGGTDLISTSIGSQTAAAKPNIFALPQSKVLLPLRADSAAAASSTLEAAAPSKSTPGCVPTSDAATSRTATSPVVQTITSATEIGVATIPTSTNRALQVTSACGSISNSATKIMNEIDATTFSDSTITQLEAMADKATPVLETNPELGSYEDFRKDQNPHFTFRLPSTFNVLERNSTPTSTYDTPLTPTFRFPYHLSSKPNDTLKFGSVSTSQSITTAAVFDSDKTTSTTTAFINPNDTLKCGSTSTTKASINPNDTLKFGSTSTTTASINPNNTLKFGSTSTTTASINPNDTLKFGSTSTTTASINPNDTLKFGSTSTTTASINPNNTLKFGSTSITTASINPNHTLKFGSTSTTTASINPNDTLKFGSTSTTAASINPNDTLKFGSTSTTTASINPNDTLKFGFTSTTTGSINTNDTLKFGSTSTTTASINPNDTFKFGSTSTTAASINPNDTLKFGSTSSTTASINPNDTLKFGSTSTTAASINPNDTLKFGSTSTTAASINPNDTLKFGSTSTSQSITTTASNTTASNTATTTLYI